jgi:hypothetical protein
MDPNFPTFKSIAELKQSQVHYNHYNVFHILERKLLLHNKAIEIAASKDAPVNAGTNESTAEPDKSTDGYKMYHSLIFPPLPPRYHCLNLPPHWFVDLVNHQNKRRPHRKSHGLIPFKELAQMIADNHKSADYETREFCQIAALKIMAHNKNMIEEFHRAHKKKKSIDQQPREVTQESVRPALTASQGSANAPSLQLDANRRHSDAGVNVQQMMLQAYKNELERERVMYLDLSATLAERERSMSMANSYDSLGRQFPYPLSAPISNRDMRLSSSWDLPGSHFLSSPYERTRYHDGRSLAQVAQFPNVAAGVSASAAQDGPLADEPMEDSAKKVNLNDDDSAKQVSSNFITILREIINDPKTDDIVNWLPCGTIFKIFDKKAFTKQLIPRFQSEITGSTSNEKYKCFKSCLDQLGFKRVTSDSYKGAYKKEGFVKTQAAVAAAAPNAASRDTSSSLRQHEMLSYANQPMFDPYPRYPHRNSLPDMMETQAGLRQGQHRGSDLMYGFYHGLAVAEMMHNRRLSLSTSDVGNAYANSELGLSFNQAMNTRREVEKKEEESK